MKTLNERNEEVNELMNVIINQVANNFKKAPMSSWYYRKCCELCNYGWNADGWYNDVIDEELSSKFCNLIWDMEMYGYKKAAKAHRNRLMKKLIQTIKNTDNEDFEKTRQNYVQRMREICTSMTAD